MKFDYKIILTLLVMGASFLIAREFSRDYFEDRISEDELVSIIKQSSHEINENLPQKIDEITVLTHTEARGTSLVYLYTLDLKADDLNPEFPTQQTSALSIAVCGKDNMIITIQNGGSFIYRYADSDSRLIEEIEIGREECDQGKWSSFLEDTVSKVSSQNIYFLVGATFGLFLVALLFRWILTPMQSQALRAVASTGFAWITYGVLAGFGMGEGGFENRVASTLSGAGFINYLVPAIVVGTGLLVASAVGTHQSKTD